MQSNITEPAHASCLDFHSWLFQQLEPIVAAVASSNPTVDFVFLFEIICVQVASTHGCDLAATSVTGSRLNRIPGLIEAEERCAAKDGSKSAQQLVYDLHWY